MPRSANALVCAVLAVVLTHVALASVALAESVTFGSRDAAVGDEVEQAVDARVRLATTARRGAEVLDQSETRTRRTSRRRIRTLDTDAGRGVAVELTYLSAERRDGDAAAADEPVAGKTYRCRRDGDELVVTDARGAIPPPEELEIVSRHMQTLGRENPLRKFLAGKTLSIGEEVDLPPAAAAQLLGVSDDLDTRSSTFRLKLKRAETVAGEPCAVFAAEIDAAATDGSQMRMQAGGELVLQQATCRAVSAELLGPIAMSHRQHDPGGTLLVSATGRVTVSIDTRYQSAVERGQGPANARRLIRGTRR